LQRCYLVLVAAMLLSEHRDWLEELITIGIMFQAKGWKLMGDT